MGKEKAGDGRTLKRYRAWHVLWRSLFGIDHDGVRWDVDVDFFDLDGRIALYRDGRQDRTQTSPAVFAFDGGGVIEVRTSTLGMRQARLVTADGDERRLDPAPGSLEHRRAHLDRTRPGLSRLIGAVSFAVLLIALVTQLPQLVELAASVTGWFEFTSPIELSSWLNTALTVAGVVAGIERASRLRYSWWLDGWDGTPDMDL